MTENTTASSIHEIPPQDEKRNAEGVDQAAASQEPEASTDLT